MFCYDPSSNTTNSYINLYANPNRDCTSTLKHTVPTLLTQIYKLSNICVIQGNFNMHCSFWDKDSPNNPQLTWDMIRVFHEQQLSLVNDKSIPTFYRSHNRPQVLDLIWLHDNAFSWFGTQVLYDIFGGTLDHKTLTLCIGSNQTMAFQNSHLLHSYIPLGSEEEEHLVFYIFDKMVAWNANDPNQHA